MKKKKLFLSDYQRNMVLMLLLVKRNIEERERERGERERERGERELVEVGYQDVFWD